MTIFAKKMNKKTKLNSLLANSFFIQLNPQNYMLSIPPDKANTNYYQCTKNQKIYEIVT